MSLDLGVTVLTRMSEEENSSGDGNNALLRDNVLYSAQGHVLSKRRGREESIVASVCDRLACALHSSIKPSHTCSTTKGTKDP